MVELFVRGRVTPAEAFGLLASLESGASSRPGTDLERSAQATPHIDEEAARQKRLQAVMDELDALIGLRTVKRLVREVYAYVEIQRRRRLEALCADPLVLHMIFKGNPGTGKTTVARIFGRIFHEMGVLPKGHIVECERADLVGEYVGHTAQRTREQIKKAMGGILFIDEAYSLARGGEKDFGKEGIDTLVKAMEDHKSEIVVILAGYSDEMEFFLQSNPGLRSRFPIQIEFPDYTVPELMRIAQRMAREREYRLAPEARQAIERRLKQAVAQAHPHFGNARMVRNLIERAVRRQAVRLVRRPRLSREDLMLLDETDFREAADG